MRVLLLALLLSLVQNVSGSDLSSLPLNRYPFVVAHDCGTGYLKPEHIKERIVYDWTKTQDVNLTQQLECGVRAFDWRPEAAMYPAGSNQTFLGFHHGPIFIPHEMEAALAEVVAWANAHQEDKEDALVLINMWDCEGLGSCDALARQAFQRQGVPLHTLGDQGASCGENVTVAEAMSFGQLAGGGSVFATLNCRTTIPYFPPEYNDELECGGFLNQTEGDIWRAKLSSCLQQKTLVDCIETVAGILDVPAHYSCYPPSPAKHIAYAFDRIRESWVNITNLAPPPPPKAFLYSIQGSWAENVESIVLGFLHLSSLIKDEERSSFNAYLTQCVNNGTFLHLPSQIGINNVCNGGNALKAALRARALSQLAN